jgi:outer membrane protein insertion porin family
LKESSVAWGGLDSSFTASWRRCAVGGLLLIVLLVCSVPALAQENVISDIRIHGNRRIPAETIKARIFTHPGDVYDQAAMDRDFMSLWNTGYFEDLRFERETTNKGWIIHIYVTEKPTIREIHYVGLSSISQSDVLDRFKERKVGLTQESQYDPTKVKKAEVVIKQLLAEHGRQFAVVRTEVKPIPPAAVAVTFNVKEGPKVKVGNIRFEGNKHLGTRYLRSSMKNLKPIGVPHSIFLEDLISRTYDATKLSEDTERVRMAYQHKGYFKALVQDPKTQIRDTHPPAIHFPLFQKAGKRVDIIMPVEEGEQFRLAAITFTGNKAIKNTQFLRSLFAMKDGDIFDTELVRKGLDNLRKAYGEYGYINFTPVPDTKIDDDKKLITLNIDVDEGKQFYVRRIEFSGNTTTRDKVIRRELVVEEGQVYNSRLWEMSLLRLNQLGYFDQLKPEEATERKLNEQEGTVDLTLKVKEKGKNSIGLTGGVSGLAGTFIGINYETNNFLGLGETLSVAANVGNIQRNITFGFTEPYAFDRPLQLGGTVYYSKYNYNQAKQTALLLNQNLNLPQSELNLLQNYTQSSTGFTMSATYPLRRSFKRIGISYGYDRSTLQTFSPASTDLFQFLQFRSISGPNALEGIVTSKITPSFTINTVSNPMHPHFGHSLFLGTDIAGFGGNVKMIRPVMEYKQFVPMKILKPQRKGHENEGHQTLGFRVQTSFLSGYGGIPAPPFQRFYMGGENDVRGFDIHTITPYAFLTTTVSVPLLNPDGRPVTDPNNSRRLNPACNPSNAICFPVPIQQLVFPGGDTMVIGNLEYRIPIAGPVTLALFNDIGIDGVARTSQLRLSSSQLQTLNTTQFGCSTFTGAGCTGSLLNPLVPATLSVAPGTNWVPRMSTGVELQVIMPVVNAPFRIYYAYNPLRLDTFVSPPNQIQRSMFPPGEFGDFTFAQALASSPSYLLREPRKTFRFTVSTTF